MKKIFVFCVMIISIISIHSAAISACSIKPDTCDTDDEYLIIPGYSGCYTCEDSDADGKCNSGDLVAATKAILGGKPYTNSYFVCQEGGAWGNDRWEPNDIPECDNRYRTLCSDPNSMITIINKNTGKPTFNDNAAQAVVGADPCMGCICASGYAEVDGQCVNSANLQASKTCTDSGGTWNNNKCECSPQKNIKLSSDGSKCECINDDYEEDGLNGCKKKQSVIDEENRQRDEENRRRQNQQRKTECENSGGVWKNNQCTCDQAKNLRTKNNVCVCLDYTNYRRQGNECILTDAAALQKECDSEDSRTSGAYWDAASKQCLCENPQHVWLGGKCEMNPAITQCTQITGANWNNTTKQCYCIQKGYEINATYTACEQTEESRREQQDAEREQAAAASRRRIEGAISDIDSIVSTLDRSKWKNAEGGFNTSRLLSDSIAGVVLGTAGGLITSHVVKKNQVEGGFEDIQCTVGGQVV